MSYPVLDPVSQAYPRVRGRLLTCYSPVRRSSTPKGLSARLACVKHAASVRPEPGSNSPKNAFQKANPDKHPSHGCCQRNPSHPQKSGCDGVVHHALAFNTLWSSQETDATTITQNPSPGPELRGVYRFNLM